MGIASNIKGDKSMTSISKYDTIKFLIKDCRYDEAIKMLNKNVSYTESRSREKGEGVEHWPYHELAKIYRKIKNYKSEVEILERYLRQLHQPGVALEELAERLIKAYELAKEIEIRYENEEPVLYHKTKGVPIDNLECFHGIGAIVDVETTGLNDIDEVIELAIILFRFSKRSGKIFEITDEYHGLREPTADIDDGAFKLHGLTIDNLKGKNLDKEHIIKLFEKSDLIIAHNANFDRKFLTRLFPMVYWKQWYCTMNGIPWINKGITTKKLYDILKNHNIKIEKEHSAVSDVKAIFFLLSIIDNNTGENYLLELIRSGHLNWDLLRDALMIRKRE